MSDYAQILADNIARLRREQGLTQSALAEKLCVSFQAISKWENKLSSPDILLLPKIAKIFRISIDELFGKKKVLNIKGAHSDLFAKRNSVSLPWENDDSIHAAVFKGHTLIEDYESAEKFTFELSGEALNVDCRCNITCDNISGDANAVGSITCNDVKGNACAGGAMHCDNVGGNTSAGSSINCDDIGGNASAGGSVTCGNVGQSASAGGNVTCGDVQGDASAGGSITCCDLSGEASAGNDIYAESIGSVKECKGNVEAVTINGDVSCGGDIIYKQIDNS